LPLLTGVEDSERLIMNTYHEIALLLRPADLKITELSYNNQGIWRLALSNGLEVLIGRDQIVEKIRRFLTIWMATLKNNISDMDGVDIRYDNGIAVRWK
jgi:cell division protein FtsQ